jgi:hypothetical protein
LQVTDEQAIFDAKLAGRRANPWKATEPSVFYHIACMNGWRAVVEEQLRLAAHVGLRRMRSVILGTEDDAACCLGVAGKHGIVLQVADAIDDLQQYELPTLQLLYEFACRCASPVPVLYWHTKGVSAPEDRHKPTWRRLMQKHVVADWQTNVQNLAVADILGVNWQDSPAFPHFSGNFWMARSDWLAGLPSPREFQTRYSEHFYICGHSWKRMCAEMWLGCKPWHHVESLACRNETLWAGPNLFGFDVSLPGFHYT